MIAGRIADAWAAGRRDEALSLAAAVSPAERYDAADALVAIAANDGSEMGREAARAAARLRAAPFPPGSAPAIEAETAVAQWCTAHAYLEEAGAILAGIADALEALPRPAPGATAAALYRLAKHHRRMRDAAGEEATWRRAFAYASRHCPRTGGALSYPLGELLLLLRQQGRATEAAEVERRIQAIPARLR